LAGCGLLSQKSVLAVGLENETGDAGGKQTGIELQYHLYLDDIFPSWSMK
jgi:hypothetical protein